MQRNEREEAEALAAHVMAMGDGQYEAVRVLPDLSVAFLSPLLFTTSICLGADRCGYARRFCFESAELARQRFAELVSEDDEPAGYIARRGR